MTEKKLWTKEQDEVLKHLKEQQCIKKWSQIARRMKLKFGKNSRNQKQCRDRYINHLRLNKEKFEWRREQEEKMIELHRKYGNKWAAIAQNFDGITQNFIKNQFYSMLRKSIRKLNKHINDSLRKEFKEFKLNLIFKLASIVDGKIKKINDIHPELNEAYRRFLYLIISFTSEDLMETLVKTHVEDEFVQKLARPLVNLEQIFYYFNKKNKKIAKEFKLSSMRFNEQIQAQAVESVQVQNELNTKIQLICGKAMMQLKQLMEFFQRTVVICPKEVKQHNIQNVFNIIQPSQLKKENETSKHKISVSQITFRKEGIEKTVQLSNDKTFLPEQANEYMKLQDDISSLIQEEPQIRDLLYEQSPRTVSFVYDHWNHSELSQFSANWQE